MKMKMQAENTQKRKSWFYSKLNHTNSTNLTKANVVLSKINFFLCVFCLHFHFQRIKKPLKRHFLKKKNQYYHYVVNLNNYQIFLLFFFIWIFIHQLLMLTLVIEEMAEGGCNMNYTIFPSIGLHILTEWSNESCLPIFHVYIFVERWWTTWLDIRFYVTFTYAPSSSLNCPCTLLS